MEEAVLYDARLLFQLKQKLLSLTEVRTESASVSTSSDKPPIEMIIGDWYLDDLGNPYARDQATRLS